MYRVVLRSIVVHTLTAAGCMRRIRTQPIESSTTYKVETPSRDCETAAASVAISHQNYGPTPQANNKRSEARMQLLRNASQPEEGDRNKISI